MLSFKSSPFSDAVSSTLKHTLPFQVVFDDTDANILRVCSSIAYCVCLFLFHLI